MRLAVQSDNSGLVVMQPSDNIWAGARDPRASCHRSGNSGDGASAALQAGARRGPGDSGGAAGGHQQPGRCRCAHSLEFASAPSCIWLPGSSAT